MNFNMEITPRILRNIAIIFVIAVLIIYVIIAFYLPYTRQAQQIIRQADGLETELALLEAQISQVDSLKEDINTITNEIKVIQQSYYTTLNQEDLILQIAQMAQQNNVLLGQLSFIERQGGSIDISDEPDEQTQELNLLGLTEIMIDTSIQGSYQENMAFIQALEGLPYDMIISSFDQSTVSPTNQVTTELSLWFYALPDILDLDHRMVRTTIMPAEKRNSPYVTGGNE